MGDVPSIEKLHLPKYGFAVKIGFRRTHVGAEHCTPSVGPEHGSDTRRMGKKKTPLLVAGGGELGAEREERERESDRQGGSANCRVGIDPAPKFIIYAVRKYSLLGGSGNTVRPNGCNVTWRQTTRPTFSQQCIR